jgi:hypothetical protein
LTKSPSTPEFVGDNAADHAPQSDFRKGIDYYPLWFQAAHIINHPLYCFAELYIRRLKNCVLFFIF